MQLLQPSHKYFNTILTVVLIIISPFLLHGQTPSKEDIRKFDDYIRKSKIHRIGAIHGEIKIDSSGTETKFNYSYDEQYISEINYTDYIKSYKFENSFKNYTIEFLYTLERIHSKEKVDYKLIIPIITEYFKELDYSEFKIEDRYLISKDKIIILPINIVAYI